jgi:hypothetical protein
MVTETLEEVYIEWESPPGQVSRQALYFLNEPFLESEITTGCRVELKIIKETLNLAVGDRLVEEFHLVVRPSHVLVEGIHH